MGMRRLLALLLFITGMVRAADPSATKSSAIEGRVFGLLSQGKQAAAEELLDKHLEKKSYSPREIFLRGVLLRSRFAEQDAAMFFSAVIQADPRSVSGRAASCMLNFDRGRHPEEQMETLETLAGENPGDVFVQWLLAIMCRAAHSNELGTKQYEKVLAVWKPGPALVHQSFANMLDQDEDFERALVERELAVKLEPAPWSYDGLANTLSSLARYDEAEKAHEQATKLDPDGATYWANWALTLMRAQKYDVAETKCRKAAALAPKFSGAWSLLGDILYERGKEAEASAMYAKAIQLNPGDVRARMAQQRQLINAMRREAATQQTSVVTGTTNQAPTPTKTR